MELAELLASIARLEPDSAAERERSRGLLAQLDLRGVAAAELERALHPSLRRSRAGPAALDAYYVSRWLALYARCGRAHYARDAALHALLQQASYRVWPWASLRAQAWCVHVGGLSDGGPLACALDGERLPRLLAPWSAAQGAAHAHAWRELAQGAEPELRRAAAAVRCAQRPLAELELAEPLGVLLLALAEVDADAALELWERARPRLACDWDLALYGPPQRVEQVAAGAALGGCELLRLDGALCAADGAEQPERLLIARRRSAAARVLRARARLPLERGWDGARRADHVAELAPARSEPNRRPAALLGRSPQAPAERPFFDAYPYLCAEQLELPAARYAVLRGGTAGEHGMIADSSGRWLEDASPPYYREAIRRLRAAGEPPPPARELAGSWAVLPAAGLSHTHWLVEGLLRLWPFESLGEPVGLLLPRPLRGYQRRLLELAGFDPARCLELGEGASTRCERLIGWLFDVGHSRELAGFLERLRERTEPHAAAGPERIFVPRGDAGPYRVCLNEELLDQGLRERGFVRVVPSELGADDEIRVFRGARVIVGALGGGLYNCAFSRPGALVLAYGSRSYMEPHLHQLAQLLAHRVHYLACEELAGPDADPDWDTRNSSYVVDVPELLRHLDRALEPPRRGARDASAAPQLLA